MTHPERHGDSNQRLGTRTRASFKIARICLFLRNRGSGPIASGMLLAACRSVGGQLRRRVRVNTCRRLWFRAPRWFFRGTCRGLLCRGLLGYPVAPGYSNGRPWPARPAFSANPCVPPAAVYCEPTVSAPSTFRASCAPPVPGPRSPAAHLPQSRRGCAPALIDCGRRIDGAAVASSAS
jgi:hypothetical protein